MVDFGGGSLTSAGLLDTFVAKYLTMDGSHVWSRSFGGPNYEVAWAAAIDGGGTVVATGHFRDSVDFPCEPITSAGAEDAFLLLLPP
jgi:hypothetical protein